MLAIAAIKLGVEKVIANEIDDDSIANAIDYFALNNVTDKVALYQCDLTKVAEYGFDVIAANITSNVIIPNLQLMNLKLKSGGKLFITGILREETETLLNELTKNNFQMREAKQRAESAAFYAIKQP